MMISLSAGVSIDREIKSLGQLAGSAGSTTIDREIRRRSAHDNACGQTVLVAEQPVRRKPSNAVTGLATDAGEVPAHRCRRPAPPTEVLAAMLLEEAATSLAVGLHCNSNDFTVRVGVRSWRRARSRRD